MWECKVVWNKWLVWMCECEWLPGYGVGARCLSAGVNWYHTLHIINWSWPPPQATNFTIISSRIVFLFKHCMMQALSSIEILRTEGTNVNNSKLWEIFNFLNYVWFNFDYQHWSRSTWVMFQKKSIFK